MTQNNATSPCAQDAQSVNLTQAAHLAAKSVFLAGMAENLTGADAAHCEALSTKSACAAAFLAEHMEEWPI